MDERVILLLQRQDFNFTEVYRMAFALQRNVTWVKGGYIKKIGCFSVSFMKNNCMEAIKINVNKQIDGFTFSITPSIRQRIRSLFPNAYPANNIFVSYDTKSDFELFFGRLEGYIYPALLGINEKDELTKKVNEIQFIDTQTGKLLHTHKVSA